MLTTRLTFVIDDKLPQGKKSSLLVKTDSFGIHPPVKYKIRVTKPNTGEHWFLRSGDSLPTEHCGALIVQPERAYVYDYLGLFRLKIRNSSAQIIRIMPQPSEIPLPHALTRYLSRAWRPKHGCGYAETYEIRPYRPGDQLNLVHWKLSAKADDFLLREPMEPEHGLIRLTMELNGTPTELDRKFGRLLWLGNWLLNRQIAFELAAMTGRGEETWLIPERWVFWKCIDLLLAAPYAPTDATADRKDAAPWEYSLGGEADET